MDTQLLSLTSKYHVSKRSESRLSNELQPIQLVFAQLAEIASTKLTGHCLKINHYKIEYNLQVSFNATGLVLVEIHGTSLVDC